MMRLNFANHPNIVKQVAFYKDYQKQTTQLVMEALNGMTLLETLYDETAEEDELINISPQSPGNLAQANWTAATGQAMADEESKEPLTEA